MSYMWYYVDTIQTELPKKKTEVASFDKKLGYVSFRNTKCVISDSGALVDVNTDEKFINVLHFIRHISPDVYTKLIENKQ